MNVTRRQALALLAACAGLGGSGIRLHAQEPSGVWISRIAFVAPQPGPTQFVMLFGMASASRCFPPRLTRAKKGKR